MAFAAKVTASLPLIRLHWCSLGLRRLLRGGVRCMPLYCGVRGRLCVVCYAPHVACCMLHAACLRCAWLFVTPLEVQRRLLILHSHEVTEPASDQMQTERHRCVACCVLSVVGCILAACCAIVSPVLDLALHCRRLQQLVRRRKLAAADLSVQHNRRRACTRRSFPRLNKLILCGAK